MTEIGIRVIEATDACLDRAIKILEAEKTNEVTVHNVTPARFKKWAEDNGYVEENQKSCDNNFILEYFFSLKNTNEYEFYAVCDSYNGTIKITPYKNFKWGDEKIKTVPTKNEYYKQRLRELWLYWLMQSELAKKNKEYPQEVSTYFAGKAEGFLMAYLLLDGFDLPNEDKR